MISTAMTAAMTWVVTRRRGEAGAACALGGPAVTEVPAGPKVPAAPELPEAAGAAAADGAGLAAAVGMVDGPRPGTVALGSGAAGALGGSGTGVRNSSGGWYVVGDAYVPGKGASGDP
jgi:hypothetical protein